MYSYALTEFYTFSTQWMQEYFSCTGTHIASSALVVQGTNKGTYET